MTIRENIVPWPRRNVPHRADTQRQSGPEELRGAGEGVGRGGEIEPPRSLAVQL